MNIWIRVGALGAALILSAVGYEISKERDMLQIKIDIGQNIAETAKQSGVPKFSTRNIAGLVSYSVASLPENLPITFIRPGYEASFAPVFALTFYADHDHNNNLAANTAVLQFSTDALTSHASGQDFVEAINTKFLSKKWARYIPELCPAVTGRSSFIDTDGAVKRTEVCPLDPSYQIKADDWRILAKAGLSYQWIGDGVIATLSVDASEDSRGVTYLIFLEYEDYAMMLKKDAKKQAKQLADGDKNGWNSTEKFNIGIAELKETIKLLEENAVKRGDLLIPRVNR